jgi:hypothetical protein
MPDAYQPLFPGGKTAGYVAKFHLTSPASPVHLNAASFVEGDNPILEEGPVTPGEILAIFGTQLPTVQ